MARRQSPPIPQPANPSAAGDDVNYLSAQVQQLLALVLPAPVVTILASVSDLLYRLTLGKSNDPPSYTSTLVPPAILLLVTYLSFMLLYRSIKSMFSLFLFSLKWAIVLGVLIFLVAYHLGDGDVQQGARVAAGRTGVDLSGGSMPNSWSDALKNYPMAQRFAPILLQNPAAAAPVIGQTLHTLWQTLQNPSNAAGSSAADPLRGNAAAPASYGRYGPLREHRDLPPSSRRRSEQGAPDGIGSGNNAGWFNFGNSRSASSAGPADQRKSSYANVNADADSIFNAAFASSPNSNARRASGSSQQPPRSNAKSDDSSASVVDKLSRWMGADLGGSGSSSPSTSSKQGRR